MSLVYYSPTRDQHMHFQMELEEQVKGLLNTARRSKKKPALSLEELAVAVLVVQPGMTLKALQRHILTAFKYYNAAAVDASINRGSHHFHHSRIISEFNVTFSEMFRRFDLPIDVYTAEGMDEEDEELEVQSCAARIFLQKYLAPPDVTTRNQKRPFPFMKLPTEIRLQIYGHVLGLPKSGVGVRQADRWQKGKEVVVRTRDFESELNITDWEEKIMQTGVRSRWDDFERRYRNDGTFKCQNLREHLAILRVNKEIFNEAMPVFYSINSFVCSDLQHLEDFLATLAPERREQLKHISFFYTKSTHSKAAKAFKMLGDIEKLKRLDIVIDEQEFAEIKRSNGERMFPDVLKLPGFHTLKSMRAVKTVQFHGECDKIRNALQSWVVDNEVKAAKPKPKRKKQVRVAEKVVKVVENEDEEDGSLFGMTPNGSDLAMGEDYRSDMEPTISSPMTLSAELLNTGQDMNRDQVPLPNRYYAPGYGRDFCTPQKGDSDSPQTFRFQERHAASHVATKLPQTIMFGGPTTPPAQRYQEEEEKSKPNLGPNNQCFFTGWNNATNNMTKHRRFNSGSMFNWSTTPSQLEDAFTEGHTLQMQDLVVEREEYELEE